MRERTVRRPLEPVQTDYIQILWSILDWHQPVTLAVDVMFVNGVPFLVSVSRSLNFITVEVTPTRTAKALASKIEQISHLYAQGGLTVGTLLMDNEFKKVPLLIPSLALNTTVAKEHVPEVKQRIHLIEEIWCSILNTLPFKQMPQAMLIELIYYVVLWLNAFLSKLGILRKLSPHELVL